MRSEQPWTSTSEWKGDFCAQESVVSKSSKADDHHSSLSTEHEKVADFQVTEELMSSGKIKHTRKKSDGEDREYSMRNIALILTPDCYFKQLML